MTSTRMVSSARTKCGSSPTSSAMAILGRKTAATDLMSASRTSSMKSTRMGLAAPRWMSSLPSKPDASLWVPTGTISTGPTTLLSRLPSSRESGKVSGSTSTRTMTTSSLEQSSWRTSTRGRPKEIAQITPSNSSKRTSCSSWRAPTSTRTAQSLCKSSRRSLTEKRALPPRRRLASEMQTQIDCLTSRS